jgi:hypothetical protein
MDVHERREVLSLVKYARKNTRMVIDQAMVLGRLNKRALRREGMTALDIQTAINKLRIKLKDYRSGENE